MAKKEMRQEVYFNYRLIVILTVFVATLNGSLFSYVESEKVVLSWLIPEQSFLTLRRNEGPSLACNRSYTTIENYSFFHASENLWPFLNVRAHCVDGNGFLSANIGGGVRYTPAWSETIFGINAFYDCRNANHFNFGQIGIGCEFLGPTWSFRVNGYLPIERKSYLCDLCFCDEYIGDYFVMRERFLEGLSGVDFEIESFILDRWSTKMYLAIGPYFYKGVKKDKDLLGSRFRLTAYFKKYFTFGVSITNDSIFKTRAQAQIGVVIPLYHHEDNWVRLFQPITRQEQVVCKKREWWTWNY